MGSLRSLETSSFEPCSNDLFGTCSPWSFGFSATLCKLLVMPCQHGKSKDGSSSNSFFSADAVIRGVEILTSALKPTLGRRHSSGPWLQGSRMKMNSGLV